MSMRRAACALTPPSPAPGPLVQPCANGGYDGYGGYGARAGGGGAAQLKRTAAAQWRGGTAVMG